MSENLRYVPKSIRAERAAKEIEAINTANTQLRNSESLVPELAKGTSPGTRLEDLDGNSWAEITEIDALSEDANRETTTDVGDALRDIGVKGNLPASSETLQAMKDIKELGKTFNDPEVIAERKRIIDEKLSKPGREELEAMSDSVLRTAERNISSAKVQDEQRLRDLRANLPASRELTAEEKLGAKNKGRDIFIDKLSLQYVQALEDFDPNLTKGKSNEEVSFILPPSFTLRPWKLGKLKRLKELHGELIKAIEDSNNAKSK